MNTTQFASPSNSIPISQLDFIPTRRWSSRGRPTRPCKIWALRSGWRSMRCFALTRYDSVIRALKDPSAFPSASGVMMKNL